MAATGTGSWITFFKDAGLPAPAAATYALTFTENRIRMDMLLDLNKEILKDMKINLMGDVIAILRHARRVHEQTAREKVLAGSPAPLGVAVSSPASVSNMTSGRSSPNYSSDSDTSSPHVTIRDTTPKPRSTAASRMVQHYVKQTESPASLADKSAAKVDASAAKTSKVVLAGVKRKVKTKESAAPVVKKVRRVLPEHEGRYKITMPSGSTPRSQQILAKQGLLPAKKTVFERLGEGSVSSTTESDGPLITITGLGTKIVKNDKQSSVFSRLGDKQRVTSSTAPDLDEDDGGMDCEDDDDEPSPYAGVFKIPTKKTVLVKKLPDAIKTAEEATMRADAESSSVTKKKVLLQSRLGGSGSSSSRTVKSSGMLSTIVKPSGTKTLKTTKIVKRIKNKTAGILANPTNATKVSVKARLGSSGESSHPTLANATTTVVKRKPEPIVYNSTNPPAVKSVTFGAVTQKLYPKEPSQSNFRPRITVNQATAKRTSVFGRLGT